MQTFYPHKSQFLYTVLRALHMPYDRFMYNLAHGHLYEIILYLWIDKLYRKDKTSDEAVQLIYKARNRWLHTPPKPHKEEPICYTQTERKPKKPITNYLPGYTGRQAQ